MNFQLEQTSKNGRRRFSYFDKESACDCHQGSRMGAAERNGIHDQAHRRADEKIVFITAISCINAENANGTAVCVGPDKFVCRIKTDFSHVIERWNNYNSILARLFYSRPVEHELAKRKNVALTRKPRENFSRRPTEPGGEPASVLRALKRLRRSERRAFCLREFFAIHTRSGAQWRLQSRFQPHAAAGASFDQMQPQPQLTRARRVPAWGISGR
ncbi:MAG: hypothetical protein JWN94_4411 [Betaproteobacteria bacterium]|nr:hypothetical protein [Betaproteobacteria bacterium]